MGKCPEMEYYKTQGWILSQTPTNMKRIVERKICPKEDQNGE